MPRLSRTNHDRGLFVALSALLLGLALHWPATPLFRDEVGYIGQARLLLQGTFRPGPRAVVHAFETDGGVVAAYPYAMPLLLAVPFAIAPRAVFVVNVLAALAIAVGAARIFERWGRSPLWGAVLLLHPTLLLLVRTAMADVVVAAAAVWAWLTLEREDRWATVVSFAFLVLAKPYGILIAVALLAGAAWSRAASGAPAVAGITVGAAGSIVLNVLSTGSAWSVYGRHPATFRWESLPQAGGLILVLLLLAPPGLVLGSVPLARRRAWGPLGAAAALVILMSFYGFSDRAPGLVETLVVGPRLILPAVVFLTMGWLDGLASLLERLERPAPSWSTPLVAATLLAASYATGRALEPRETTMTEALRSAEAELRVSGGDSALGVTDTSWKAAILSRSRLVQVLPHERDAAVVLCGRFTESHRDPLPSRSCDLPGYLGVRDVGPYSILVRAPVPGGP